MRFIPIFRGKRVAAWFFRAGKECNLHSGADGNCSLHNLFEVRQAAYGPQFHWSPLEKPQSRRLGGKIRHEYPSARHLQKESRASGVLRHAGSRNTNRKQL